MKLKVSLFVALCQLLGNGAEAAHPKVKMTGDVEDSYIVVLKSNLLGVSSASVADTLTASNPNISVQSTFSKVLNGFSVKMTQEEAEAMAESDLVDYIEQDGEVQAIALDPWGLDRIDQVDLPLDDAFNALGDGEGATAYILDTGIRTTHNEFDNGRATWGTNTIDNDNRDCNGHGTHVAGTVAGKDYGVAPKAKVVAVKVLACSGGGTWASVIDGMEWVATDAQGKKATANMSLGGGRNTAVNDAATALHNGGVVTVVAAGNNNADACGFSPAGADDIMTVGSTDIDDDRSSFSNYGTCVDIFAPGRNINSAWWNNDSDYRSISGTSMASPHVCGGAALLLANGMDPADVDDALYAMASENKVNDPRGENLLLYVGGNGPPPSTPPPAGPPTRPPSPSSCFDSPTEMWRKGNKSKACADLTNRQCNKGKFKSHCPEKCNACDLFECEDSRVWFWTDAGTKFRCKRLENMSDNKKARKCNKQEIRDTCRRSCDTCR